MLYSYIQHTTLPKVFFLKHRIIAQEHNESVHKPQYVLLILYGFFSRNTITQAEHLKEYAIEGFNEIFRNDQMCNSTGRPPHGQVAYVKGAKSV